MNRRNVPDADAHDDGRRPDLGAEAGPAPSNDRMLYDDRGVARSVSKLPAAIFNIISYTQRSLLFPFVICLLFTSPRPLD